MRPMLGWEVIEGKQDFFIFLQAFAGLRKFDLVTGDKLIVGCQSRFAGRRQVHFMDQLLGLALNAFLAFYRGYLPSYAPSTAAVPLGRILPAGRSKSQANRRRWPASARWNFGKRHDKLIFRAQLFYFMGEVEAVFGIWLIPLFAAIITFHGWSTMVGYVGNVNVADPIFVVVIMAMASSLPIIRFTEAVIAKVSQ